MSSKSVGRRGLDEGDVEGRCDKNSMSPNCVALYGPGDDYVRITPDGFWRWFKARPRKVGSAQPEKGGAKWHRPPHAIRQGKSQILASECQHRVTKMPEKSRGRKALRGGARMASAADTKKQVAFEAEQMDLDEKFEQLKAPLFKGKKLDDPIKSPLVSLPVHPSKCPKTLSNYRINGNYCLLFSKSKAL